MTQKYSRTRTVADMLITDLLKALSNTDDDYEGSPHYQLGYLSSLMSQIIAQNPGSEDILISRIKTVKDRAKVTETA